MSQPAPSSAPRRLRAGLAAVLLAGTALGGFAAGHYALAAGPEAAQIAPAAPARAIPDFVALVKRVKPAVVSITTMLKPQPGSDQQIITPFGVMRPHAQAVEARGSGFIINANGTIVTNNHVVKDAKSVSVTLSDGTKLPAKIVGRDPRTDIAVLRIDAGHPLAFVSLGDSSKVQVGEWVVAMGNPFGLGGTVTAGIVSARGRDIGAGPYDSFLQIDAPINEGNSGGPLFTQNGEVVGVNSAIITPSGGSVGIGFAIPSNMVKSIVAQLEAHGHVTRGYLGVETQAVTPAMIAALHLPSGDTQGALVAAVEPNSPAAKAGFQPGDVVRSVDGKPVADPRALAVAIAGVHPGSTASIGVMRNGSQETLTATVANLADQNLASGSGGSGEHQAGLGVALGTLTPRLRSELNVPMDTEGAVVMQVAPGSPAARAGIQRGDIIMGVGNEKVSSPAEAARLVHEALRKDHAVALRIMHDGQTMFVAIDVGKNG